MRDTQEEKTFSDFILKAVNLAYFSEQESKILNP